jgi:hypothetical protein
MARERRPKEVQRIFDQINSARREVLKAVDRAAAVDLREGHIAEARRRAMDVKREADNLIRLLEGK